MVIITYDVYNNNKIQYSNYIQGGGIKDALGKLQEAKALVRKQKPDLSDFIANVRISEHTEELDF